MTQETPPLLSVEEPEKDILGKLMGMHWRCARLIAITARDNMDGTMEVIYSFHLDGEMVHHRFVSRPEWELESVADLWAGARNMEREAIDLLGLKFKGQEGGLLLVPGKSKVAPLRKEAPKEVEKNG